MGDATSTLSNALESVIESASPEDLAKAVAELDADSKAKVTAALAAIKKRAGKHVVFMSMSMTGHLNPTLPVVKELVSRGVKVTFYVNKNAQAVVEAVGATWRPVRHPDISDSSDFAMSFDGAAKEQWKPDEDAFKGMKCMTGYIYGCVKQCPLLIEDFKSMQPRPSVIVGDPAFPFHRVVGHALGLPVVGFFTMPGPGCLSIAYRGFMSGTLAEAAEVEGRPWVAGPAETIKSTYGIDLFKDASMFEFHGDSANVCTTTGGLFAPAANEVQKSRFDHFPWTCVGPITDSTLKRVDNIAEKDPMLDEIDAAIAASKQVLYISLGTVATGPMWTGPLGTGSQGNEEAADGQTNLTEMTGKELCQYVWTCAIEAFGNQDNVFVIMTTSTQEDAMDGIPPAPPNFIVRARAPQLDVLQRAGAFISHGGANSIHEALAYGVPLAILPIFGDQIMNADTVANVGAGFSFRHPMKTVNAATMREKAMMLLNPDVATNSYRAKARELAKEFATAGGASMAADTILNVAK